MWPTPKVAALLLWAHSVLVNGSPIEADAAASLAKRACPNVHVFGARETTAPAGYGSSSTVVNLILQAYPGATSEAITYPACGGQSTCGGVSYGDSAQQGYNAVASAVNSFYQQCPQTQLVLVGYSQGGQIVDNAVCGGPDAADNISSSTSPISAGALAQVKAVIEMGSPRFVYGLPYNVGTCTTHGFDARPSGYTCGGNQGSKIQSYCDSADPYCCTGNDANVHQGYGAEYGAQALAFVKTKLSASGGSTGGTGTSSAPPSTSTPAGSTGGSGGSCSALWGQCGGQGWTGPTCCSSGTCKASNQWYSQCLN